MKNSIELVLTGFLLAFVVYNIFMFFAVQRKVHIYLSLFYFILVVIFFHRNGYLIVFEQFLPKYIANRLGFMAISMASIAFFKMAIYYFDLKKNAPALIRFLLIFQGVYVVVFLLALIKIIPDSLFNSFFGIHFLFACLFLVFVSVFAGSNHTRVVCFLLSVVFFFIAQGIHNPIFAPMLPDQLADFNLDMWIACLNTLPLIVGTSEMIIFNAREKKISDDYRETNLILKKEIELRINAEEELLSNQLELEQLYKKQSIRLIEKENHFKYMVENLSDWVWHVDTHKKFTHNNHKVHKLLGYHPEELFNTSILELVDNEHSERLNHLLDNCLIHHKGFIEISLPILSAELKKIPIEMSGQVIRDHNHDVIGVLGIARDLRPKHISEQLLLKNIHLAEEKERKRLSTEIHDGIGPILSAINLYLGTATSGNICREKEIELLGKVQHSVTEVANELRNISNNLIPVEFVNRTLVENISILADRLSTGAGVHCLITCDHFNPFISDEKSLVVYRIISELLNNTIRHGKASKIEIVFKQSENDILVSYTDNGAGFNLNNQQKHPTGLGLNSIKTRLKTLDATFLFYSEPGKGMKIEFSFPIEPQNERNLKE